MDISQNLLAVLRCLVDGSDDTWLLAEDALERAAVHGDPGHAGTTCRDCVSDGLPRGIFQDGLSWREGVKLFFIVALLHCRKDGRVRLIVDCRRSNRHFHAPQATRLVSGAGFFEVYAGAGAAMWIASVTIETALCRHWIQT